MKDYWDERDDDGSGDDWTVDLEDLIARQTMREADLDEDEEEEEFAEDDAVLFDEYEEDEDEALSRKEGRRETGKGSRRESRRESSKGTGKESRQKNSQGSRRESRSENFDESPKESRRQKRAARKEEKEYEEFQAYRRGKKRRKRHRIRRALIILAVVVLLVYALGTIALRLLGIQTSLSGISGSFNEGVSSNAAMKGYTNIALFGVDSRDEDLGEGNRTDVMIIASINNLTGDIQLVSVYRDTYLDIGDGDYQKANAAYAYGGAEQAITMLNTNLDMNITDYVTIGFAGVADLIDIVGGVEITVTEEEISHLNNYQLTMAEQMGVSYTEVTEAGTQTLNGLQAVAYCRIRYTDGGDFQRTERQKAVLSAAFAKLTSSGPITILQAAAALSDEIETSLSTSELAWLAVRAFTYEITDTNGFPNEDLRTTGYIGDASCVIPITLASNVTWLHEYLFGDEDYEPSETVQTISAYISSVSGCY